MSRYNEKSLFIIMLTKIIIISNLQDHLIEPKNRLEFLAPKKEKAKWTVSIILYLSHIDKYIFRLYH